MKRVSLLIMSLVAACGDSGSTSTQDSVTDTGVATDTAVAPDTAADTAPDTAVEDTAVVDTAVEDTAVEDTAVEDTAIEDTAIEDTAVDSAPADTTVPPVCLDATAERAEGMYRDSVLVNALLASERCSKDDSACVPARCFAAETGFAEGVYALAGEARGDRLEVCGEGFRCDDATPHCERVPNEGLPVGFACANDLECAGPEAFDGRCIAAPGGFEMSEGRCGHGCAGAGDCPGGSHCAFLDGDDPVCVADCPAFVACPPLATCQDGDGDGEDECLPLGTEKTRVGASCTVADDCGGDPAHAFCVLDNDVFWVGGYCMTYTCRVEADCQPGTHCGYFGSGIDGGLCIADCDAQGECARADHGCWDSDRDGRNECVPSGVGAGEVNAACDSIEDCGGGTSGQCIFDSAPTDGSGRCTRVCTTDDDCPGTSICTGRSANAGGACRLPCEDESACAATQACFDRDFDGRKECGFAGEGAVPQNGACTVSAQCGTGPRGFCLAAPNFSGMCTQNCFADAECGAASHCVRIDGNGSGFCMPDCDSGASTCTAPEACIDFDADEVSECGPAGTGLVALGERCTSGAECGGGAGSFCGAGDQICTRFCGVDSDCGSGARCVDFGGPHLCRKRCNNNAQCSTSMRCVDADADGNKECIEVGIGLNPIGEGCFLTDTCERGNDLLCVPGEPGGVCTRACSATLPCEAGSHCGQLPSESVSACVVDCTSNDDCRVDEGYACFDGDGNGSKECLPFGNGPGTPGDACTTVVDCAGGARARCEKGPAAFSGVCALTCGGASTCAADDSCVALPDVSTSLCLAGCSDDDDCRDNFTCEDVDAAGGSECVHACASDDDCRLYLFASTCGSAGVCQR